MSLAKIASSAALRALKTYGAPATLTRVVPGAYDPATGGVTAGTTTTCNTSAVLDATAKSLGFKFGEGLIQAGASMATLTAKGLTFTPAPGDKFTVGAIAYVVIAVRPVWAGATAVLYELLVRL